MSNIKHSDYSKGQHSVSKTLADTEVFDSELNQSFYGTVTDRFLTKTEIARAVGKIGSSVYELPCDTSYVQEADPHNQANQVQVVPRTKIGTEDRFLSYKDFMTLLSRHGVDIRKAQQWGRLESFNYLPPINLDKFSNYQDYFWCPPLPSQAPEYITIANVAGQVDDKLIHLFSRNADYVGHHAPASPYEGMVWFDLDTLGLSQYVSGSWVSVTSLSYDIDDVNVVTNTITVTSDITQRVQAGTVVYFEKSLSHSAIFATVVSVAYDQATNSTSLVIDGVSEFGELRDRTMFIDVILQVVLAERDNYTNPTEAGFRVKSRDPFAYSMLADIVWAKYTNIVTSDGGTFELGSTEMSDESGDIAQFVDTGVRAGDFTHIAVGPNKGFYEIEAIVGDLVLSLNVPNETAAFFAGEDTTYQLLRSRPLFELISRVPPANPLEGDYWADVQTDTLRQFTTLLADPESCPDLDLVWVPVLRNFSLLTDQLGTRYITNYYPESNGWTASNYWRHRSVVTALGLAGVKQAQLPIIEFNDGLELAEWRRIVYTWAYRTSASANFKAVEDANPPLFELRPLEVYYPETTTSLSIGGTYGDRTADFPAGTQFRITESLGGQLDGIYTVKEAIFVRYATAEFRTRLILEEATPLRAVFSSPGGKVVPVTTSRGDPWAGYDIHWRFDGIDRVTMTSPRQPSVLNTISHNLIDSYEAAEYDVKVALGFQEVAITTPTTLLTIDLDERLHERARYSATTNATVVTVNGIRRTDYVDVESTLSGNYVGGIAFTSSILVNVGDVIRIELGPVVSSDIGRTSVPVFTGTESEFVDLSEFRVIPQAKVERNQQPLFAVYDTNLGPVDAASPLFEYVTDEVGGSFNFWIQRSLKVVDGQYVFASRILDDEGKLYAFRDKSLRFSEQVDSTARSIWFSDPASPTFVAPEFVDRCGRPVCILTDDGELNPEGFWKIPDYWSANIANETREEVSATALNAHFRSIIDAQRGLPGPPEERAVFFISSAPNLSAGGTIKSFNYGTDLTISSLMLNSTDPVSILEYAHNTYAMQLDQMKELMRDVVASTFSSLTVESMADYQTAVIEQVIARFEGNDEFNRLFGDSFNSAGIRNFVDTLPVFGMVPYTVPQLMLDDELGIESLLHHDGHISKLNFNVTAIRQFLSTLIKTRVPTAIRFTDTGSLDLNTITQYAEGTLIAVVSSTTAPTTTAAPTSGSPTASMLFEIYISTESGYELYRPESLTFVNLERSSVPEYLAMYEPEVGTWELVVTEDIVIDLETALMLEVETRLYDVQRVVTRQYNVSTTVPDSNYVSLMRARFEEYARNANVSDPYASIYTPTDPFTWNYSGATIQSYPQLVSPSTRGSWQGLYETYYGTPTPHLEPWKLQNFMAKPDWWDTEYPPEAGRRWSSAMWFNIAYGIIPVGRTGPNGTSVSTEFDNQLVAGYAYIPVNTESLVMTIEDGNVGAIQTYGPDELLPPYIDMTEVSPLYPSWVRSLYGKNVLTGLPESSFPNRTSVYQYGTVGPVEAEWRSSSQYLYDQLIVAWQIDPIRFTYLFQGFPVSTIGRLMVDSSRSIGHSHANQQFHGDYIGGTTEIYQSSGLNQWYVNYHRQIRQDVTSGEFRTVWTTWEPKLSYLFNRFVVPSSIELSSPTADIVAGDFELGVKDTEALDVLDHSALKVRVISAPNRYSPLREAGKDWTFEIDTYSPVNSSLKVREVENYAVSFDPVDTYKWYINRFDIASVTRYTTRTYQVVNYNGGWRSYDDLTSLNQIPAATYTTTFTVTSGSVAPSETVTVNVATSDTRSRTIGGLIEMINEQLVNSFGSRVATVAIRNGNLAIYSYNRNTAGRTTILADDIFHRLAPTNSETGSTYGNYVAIDPPVTGDAYEQTVIAINGNRTLIIEAADSVILQGTNGDGTYAVSRVEYDLVTDTTLLYFEYEMPLDLIGTGVVIRPTDGPGAWTIGDEVLFTSSGTLPSPLSESIPYSLAVKSTFPNSNLIEYVVVSPSSATALKVAEFVGRGVDISTLPASYVVRTLNSGTGESKLGRLVSTFQALQGASSKTYWRRHHLASSTRTYNTPLRVTSVQELIDFVHGYEAAAKDDGFVFSVGGDTLTDTQTGRPMGWQLELEKLITVLFKQTFNTIEMDNDYEIVFLDESTLTFRNAVPANWSTSTPVRISRTDGNLPAMIQSTSETATRQTVFYTIPDARIRGAFKLAHTANDAAVGNYITFDVPMYSPYADPVPYVETVTTGVTRITVEHMKGESDLSKLTIVSNMTTGVTTLTPTIEVTSSNKLTFNYSAAVTGTISIGYAPTTYASYSTTLTQPALAATDSQYAVTQFSVIHGLGVSDLSRLLASFSTETTAASTPLAPSKIQVIDSNTILLGFDEPVEGGVQFTIKPTVRQLSGKMTARALRFVPAFESALNPYREGMWIETPRGIVRDINEVPEYDGSLRTMVFDVNGAPVRIANMLPLRFDKLTKLHSRPTSTQTMAGARIVTKGREHVLIMSNTSVDGSTIYDQFLGNRGGVFYIEFEGQPNQTFRTNIGGYFTSGTDLIRNMEGNAEDLRYAYDPYVVPDSSIIGEAARDTIGYDGSVPFLRDNNINKKSQFLFWKAMINYKGTKVPLTAFLRGVDVQDIIVDEFWAYKVAEFGSAHEQTYPEMILQVEDSVGREMKVEFLLPQEAITDTDFTGIRLTDATRWANHPDLVAEYPHEAFFLNSAVTYIDTNPQWIIIDEDNAYYVAPRTCDGILIIRTLANGDVETYHVGGDADRINTQLYRVRSPVSDTEFYNQLTIALLGVDVDAQDTAALIDKKSRTVVDRVTLWDPARGLWDQIGYQSIDTERATDPALYSQGQTLGSSLVVSSSTTAWLENKVGTTWLDTSRLRHVPYYDSSVFPVLDDRTRLWGALEPWSSLSVYEWTVSDVDPSQWEALKSGPTNPDFPKSGTPFSKLYRRVNGQWIEQSHRHEVHIPWILFTRTVAATQSIPAIVTAVTSTTVTVDVIYAASLIDDWTMSGALIVGGTPVNATLASKSGTEWTFTLTDTSAFTVGADASVAVTVAADAVDALEFDDSDEVDIYINGTYEQSLPSPMVFEALFGVERDAAFMHSFVTLVRPQPVPTSAEIKAGEYRYVYPYSIRLVQDELTGERRSLYYFWVRNKMTSGSDGITSAQATRLLVQTDRPYMIWQDLRTEEEGYGAIWGNVYDQFEYGLPGRYRQMIVRGLAGRVNDNERYTLRFTRDFTLRDRTD